MEEKPLLMPEKFTGGRNKKYGVSHKLKHNLREFTSSNSPKAPNSCYCSFGACYCKAK